MNPNKSNESNLLCRAKICLWLFSCDNLVSWLVKYAKLVHNMKLMCQSKSFNKLGHIRFMHLSKNSLSVHSHLLLDKINKSKYVNEE